MARKNLLAGLTDADEGGSPPPYPIRGASKSMIRSVGELARQADAFLEGEQVVEIDPSVVDESFVADRIDDEGQQFEELLEAIRANGQNSPVLLRPHPSHDGRYMVVFGHRRVRAARDLNRKVRAVVKAVDDRMHVLAQGQENAARADLSFIEKALFAKRLEGLDHDRDLIGSALASNEAAVSKMISVVSRIPEDVITRIGAARSVGRERWVELSLLVAKKRSWVEQFVGEPGFASLSSDERFSRLMSALNASGKPVRKSAAKQRQESWRPSDRSVAVLGRPRGKGFALSLTEAEAKPFGTWIVENLDDLFETYRKSKKEQ